VAAGVDLELRSLPEGQHIFYLGAGRVPEIDAAVAEMAAWLRSKIGLAPGLNDPRTGAGVLAPRRPRLIVAALGALTPAGPRPARPSALRQQASVDSGPRAGPGSGRPRRKARSMEQENSAQRTR